MRGPNIMGGKIGRGHGGLWKKLRCWRTNRSSIEGAVVLDSRLTTAGIRTIEGLGWNEEMMVIRDGRIVAPVVRVAHEQASLSISVRSVAQTEATVSESESGRDVPTHLPVGWRRKLLAEGWPAETERAVKIL
ncbi:hypothetical protein VTK73DRAFT_1065 [Phialemonium thermophilum]|uniref:Uncharacterized protein n=1 Tax=Phialemonium thermophilum TaxID=223376 RepID=A0ABR3VU26_9PEZI